MKKALLTWYRENPRDYPWRSGEADPYVVFVSEVMLQQTQAATIAKRLPEFLEIYPTVQALAAATNGEMLKAWQGLGYNRRAIRLRDAAIEICKKYQGTVPNDVVLLDALPGIGAYASAAIVCFAYNKRAIVVDVNVRRVYSRIMTRQATTTSLQSVKDIYAFGETIVPRENASEWHHAVMDLGAHICTARKPLCASCPLQGSCPSAHVLLASPILPRTKTVEPLYYGQPNRIWRGRILKLVTSRTVTLGATTTRAATTPAATTRAATTPATTSSVASKSTSITLRALFRELMQTPATTTDLAWLKGVVQSLQADGMLTMKGSTITGMQ